MNETIQTINPATNETIATYDLMSESEMDRIVDHAIELATKHTETGMVFISGFGLAKPNISFGGVKNSGYSREHGCFGICEFVNCKAVKVVSSDKQTFNYTVKFKPGKTIAGAAANGKISQAIPQKRDDYESNIQTETAYNA